MLFIPKIRLFVLGRRRLFDSLETWRREVKGDVIWVHCASLGEFEMARPLIDHPDLSYKNDPEKKACTILITFFSPSGYEVVRKMEKYHAFYMPIDTMANARKFIALVKPVETLFVKNEFWFNFLEVLRTNQVPTYLVNGIIREDQVFFRSYGKWFRRRLKAFRHFFVQDERSAELLMDMKIDERMITVTTDMRYDRVTDIRTRGSELPDIEHFKTAEHLIIGGSTWQPEEEILADFLGTHTNFDCIIAPHEVSHEHIKTIERLMLPFGVQRYSEWDGTSNDFRVLLIDSVGLLSRIYRYGDIAFVGGGFGTGLHNILEPAGFGLPVIFGPKINRYPEAKKFIQEGIGFQVSDNDSFSRAVRAALFSKDAENVIGKIESMQGATKQIIQKLRPGP